MTGIEWTDRTWNPVTGCTKVSPGCDRCYAESIARRFAGSAAFPNGFAVTLHPDRLRAPRCWRRPSRVFVNSMSDLFHDDVPDVFIALVWATMALTPQHTYQVLTKRHGRMRSLLSSPTFWHLVVEKGREQLIGCQDDWLALGKLLGGDPPPNVWLGVSVEDQQRADLRVPRLLETPAAVRFLSCEPLLGPIDLKASVWTCGSQRGHGLTAAYVHTGECCDQRFHGIDWIIVGGESGPGARPMELDWARSLVEQCRGAGVACFVKQLGSALGPRKGGDPAGWPEDLRVREWPAADTPTDPAHAGHPLVRW